MIKKTKPGLVLNTEKTVSQKHRILFVCLGNICRSTMAEMVMKYLVSDYGDQFYIESKGTSNEEEGNGVHYGTVRKLQSVGIPCLPHRASQMNKKDYDNFDYIIGMETSNIRNILRITGGDPDGKVSRLLDWTDSPGDIADPWYTGNFDETYKGVRKGCEAVLRKLL